MLRTSFIARCFAPRPRFQPKLEVLEDRLAPAGYSVTDLGTPSGYSSFHADAINASGQIVGQGCGAGGSMNAEVERGRGRPPLPLGGEHNVHVAEPAFGLPGPVWGPLGRSLPFPSLRR
jgi:hypothetical protein